MNQIYVVKYTAIFFKFKNSIINVSLNKSSKVYFFYLTFGIQYKKNQKS